MSAPRGRWYGRPIAALCVAAAAVALSAKTLATTEFGGSGLPGGYACVVSIRQYGSNAREMERLVAIPLEDALASLPCVVETASSCEYGEVRVVARFADGRDETEAVSATAQRVYESLPGSVQRPRIGTAGDDGGPVWVAAAIADGSGPGELREALERRVKPALESLEGVGEVMIDGGGVTEIAVLLDDEAAALAGVSAEDVARALSGSDGLAPSGSIRSGGAVLSVSMDARYPSADALREAVIPGASGAGIRLGSIAEVAEREREPETLSRVDGARAVTVAVMPAGDANLARLSLGIAREVERVGSACGLRFTVLSDRGELAARSLRRVASAAIEAVVAVSIATALIVRPRRGLGSSRSRRLATASSAAMVPFVLIVSAALLSRATGGLSVGALAGLAIGLGSSVDCSILVAERLGSSSDVASGAAAVRELAPALAAGTATTIVTLAPLLGLDGVSSGAGAVAAGIALTSGVSYAATALIMPPVALWGAGTHEIQARPSCRPRRPVARRVLWRVARRGSRLLARVMAICAAKPRLVLVSAAVIGLAGVASLAVAPKDVDAEASGNDVYARLEFEQGLSVEAVDSRLAGYASSLARLPGLSSIQSSARRGSGSLLLTYDDGLTDRSSLSDSARLAAPPGSFAWIESRSPGERAWELIVRGDDYGACRALATSAAERVAGLPITLETALNFKPDAPAIVVRPDRPRSASLGLPFSIVAGTMKRSVQAPVAYKRVGETGDTDVRVGAGAAGPVDESTLGSIVVSSRGASLVASSMVTIGREEETARIQRSDRRRSASISIRTRPIDPETVERAVMAALDDLETPPGYTLAFDPDAIEAARRLRRVSLSFIAAAALAYMAMAALSESFGLPLVALAAVPPSLAAPALMLAVARSSLDASMACAFVAVSGVAVNASVLMADYVRRAKKNGAAASAMDLYRVVRSRIAIVSATAATTVVGAMPLLFLDSGDEGLIRALAFVTAAGGAASFVAAITVVPALAAAAPRLFERFGPSAR